MKIAGILWNSMDEFEQEAINDLSNYFTINDIIDLELFSNLEDFIWTIYESNNPIAIEHVKLKISGIINLYESTHVSVILMETDENCTVDYIKNTKKIIREKYSKKVTSYYFDNVLHLTENNEEYDRVLFSIKKYDKCKKKLKLDKN